MAQSPTPPSPTTPITLWPDAVQILLGLEDKELKALLRKLRKQGLVAAA